MKKIALAVFFLILVVLVYFFTPARDTLSPEGFSRLEDWIRAQGLLAPLVFGGIYVLACLFALPGSVLTISGGLLFGPWWGTWINALSAALGASLSFLLARYLGRDFTARYLLRTPFLGRLDEKLGRHAFYSILFFRLVPLFPFNGLNFGLGLTRVSFQSYALATLLGILPGSFVYTTLGAAGRHIRLTDPSTWADIRVWGPFALVILLSLLPKLFAGKK